jgi:dTMP kinase
MSHTTPTRGFLLTLEGIDGSGKSSVAKALYQALTERGFPVVLTKEPGGTPLGAFLRGILQERKFAVCPQAEFLLFAADRAQHMCQVVEPALSEGKIVISDRMADSSRAYQGFGRGLNEQFIKQVNNWAMRSLQPDLTLYLRLDYKTAAERLSKRNEKITAFEKEKAAFFERVIHGFDTIFKERSNVITLDSTQPLEAVIAEALDAVVKAIKGISV